MILGHIVGKSSTQDFKFKVAGKANKHDYIQILDTNNNYILAQIIELEQDKDSIVADCSIIGYNKDSMLTRLKTPLKPGSEVLKASDDFITKTLNLKKEENSAFLGHLEGRDKIQVYLDLNKLLTKHVCILAKSGSGKSYCLGVLIEEILERKIPVLIIDPHGEYSSLKYPNPSKNLKIKAKGYLSNIQEFSPDTFINPESRPLKLSNRSITTSELTHILPAKLSNTQLAALYSALKNIGNITDFDQLIMALEQVDNNAKYTLINIIEYLQKLDIFSNSPTELNELIKQGKASIINLKGIDPELQEVIVYKLIKDLFTERKKNNIPPFFLVIEEAHNYCPERSFKEAKSSSILRQVASEGRKFGLGLAVVSQRPARVDKNIISQCSTQLILKTTNPNDIKAISSSSEGINSSTEREIQNLPIGVALTIGIIDLPLFVKIRERKTKHGGEAVNILNSITEKEDFLEESNEFENRELLPIIKPKISLKDAKLMSDKKDISVTLIPCLLLNTKEFNLLINLVTQEIVTNTELASGIKINLIKDLSPQQLKILNLALPLKEFKPAELFAKSGLQFSEIYEVVKKLEQKGYFEKTKEGYKLNDSLSLLTNLEQFACYDKVDFLKIEFNEKLEKRINQNEIIDFLKQFINIKDKKDCYLVVYS